MSLPTDSAERKAVPLAEGLLWYFPNALAEVARVSNRGNDQHNPGQPMHWAMEKSTDHADCILRHLADAGELDTDGMRHAAKVAWRALALLETELIQEGAAPGRNAIRADPPDPLARLHAGMDRAIAETSAALRASGIGDVAHEPDASKTHGHAGDLDSLRAERSEISFAQTRTNANVIAHREGAGDYGNPTTPGCATPWRLP